MTRVASGWQVCAADTHGLPLIRHVDGPEPCPQLLAQTLRRHRAAGGVDPRDPLRVGLHPSATALHEASYETRQTPLGLQSRTEPAQAGAPRVFPPQGAPRQARRLPAIASRPLPRGTQGVDVGSAGGVVVLGAWALLCHHPQGPWTWCQALARACGPLTASVWVAPRWWAPPERLSAWRSLAVRRPGRPTTLCAALGGLERPRVAQALAAGGRSRVALPGPLRPR